MSDNSEIVFVKGAGGIMKDSVAGMARNRNALPSKRSRKVVEYEIKRTVAIRNPDLSEEELEVVITQIQLDLKLRKKRKLIYFVVCSVIVTIVTGYVFL